MEPDELRTRILAEVELLLAGKHAVQQPMEEVRYGDRVVSHVVPGAPTWVWELARYLEAEQRPESVKRGVPFDQFVRENPGLKMFGEQD